MSNLLGVGENDDLNSRNEEEKLMNVVNDGDSLTETYFEKRQKVENIGLIEKKFSNINDLLILEDQHDSVTNQIVNEEQKSADYVNKTSVCLDEDEFFQSCKRRTDSCTNIFFTSFKKRKSEINAKEENDSKIIDSNYFANDVQTSNEIENNSLLGNEIKKHADILDSEKDVNIINSGGFSNAEENMSLGNDMKNITNQENDYENIIEQSGIQNETDDTKVENNNSPIENETITNENNNSLLGNEIKKHADILDSEKDVNIINSGGFSNAEENMLLGNDMKNITNQEDDDENIIEQSGIQNETDDTKVENNNSPIENETITNENNNSLLGNEIKKHADISNSEKDVNIINSGGFSNAEENMSLGNDMKNITNQENDDENIIEQSAIQNKTDETKVENNNSPIENETNITITNENNNSLLGNEIKKHADISNSEKDVNIINSGGFSNAEENMSLGNDMKNITNQEDDDENIIEQSAIQNKTDETKVENNNSPIENETNITITNENNNSSLEIEIKIIPSLAMEVYKNGLSQDEHVEERLELVHGQEENEIRNKVLRYLPGLKINSVKRVQNNFLRGLYYLKKEEYESRDIVVQEQSLFHSTAEDNVNSIIKDNFDWRRVWRCRYGKGISFASDADYANCHANRRNANVGAKRAFIIAKVLVGKSSEGSGCLKIPPEGYDTTTGANGIVTVKYNNNEFLPEYVVFYDCNDISKSKYHERFRS